MTTLQSLARAGVPARVKTVVALLGLHTAALAFGTFAVFMEASSKHEHGQSGAVELVILGVMCAGLTGVLALSAVQTLRAVPWARPLALVLESLLLFGALIQFAALLTAPDAIGVLVAVANLAVIGAILWLLGTSGEWFRSGG